MEIITDLLWQAAKLNAELNALRRDPRLSKQAKDELGGAHWSAETVGAGLVNALAAQQLYEHLHREVADLDVVKS